MNNKLYISLRKTAFWMISVGLIMGLFNTLLWYMLISIYTSYGFGNNLGRAIPGIICLSVSTIASFVALLNSTHILRYTKHRNPDCLKKAFQSETLFWTLLTAMVFGAVLTIILIITIRL
jgi:hypothetical protein